MSRVRSRPAPVSRTGVEDRSVRDGDSTPRGAQRPDPVGRGRGTGVATPGAMQTRSALAATLATAASLFFAVPASADETPPEGLDDPPAHSSRTEVYPVPRPPLP